MRKRLLLLSSTILLILLLVIIWFVIRAYRCDTLAPGFEKDTCIIDYVKKTKNYDVCDEMTYPHVCHKFAARVKGDSSLCLELNATEQSKCQAILAFTGTNLTGCDIIADPAIRGQCQMGVVYKSESPETCRDLPEEGVPYTRLDCYNDLAIYTLNPDYCDYLPEPDMCQLAVATENADVSACLAIEDDDVQEACLVYMVPLLKDGNIKGCFLQTNLCEALDRRDSSLCTGENEKACKDAIALYTIDCLECVYEDIVRAGQPERCEGLSPYKKDRCLVSIAIKNTDADICEETAFPPDCLLSLAVLTGQHEHCEAIDQVRLHPPNASRDKCYDLVAKTTNKVHPCTLISDDLHLALCQDEVYHEQAKNEFDVAKCDGIVQNTAKKAQCYNDVAILTGDPTLCDEMEPINEYTHASLAKDCKKTILLDYIEAQLPEKKRLEPIIRPYNISYCNWDFGLDNGNGRMSETLCNVRYTKNPFICESLQDWSDKNDCYEVLAKETDNHHLCELFPDNELCVRTFADTYNNPDTCKLLKDDVVKDRCLMIFYYQHPGSVQADSCEEMESYQQSSCYQELAKKERNVSLCDNIALGNPKTWCIEGVAVASEDPELCFLITPGMNPDSPPTNFLDACLTNVAKETGQFSTCEDITEYNQRFICLTSGLEKNRVFDCSEPVNDELCRLIEAIKNEPFEACDTFEGTMQELCYYYYAPLGHNKCDEIPSEFFRSLCLFDYAEASNDVEACLDIEDSYERNRCIHDIACKAEEKSYCDLIDDDFWRDGCGEVCS